MTDPRGASVLIFGMQMAATMVCAVGGSLAAGRPREALEHLSNLALRHSGAAPADLFPG